MAIDGKELDAAFESFGSEAQVEAGTQSDGYQKVLKYREIPIYVNQDEDALITSDKRIESFNNQVTVQGESDSQYITFEMYRYYDGVDLNDMTLQVHYERPDGQGDNCPVVNVEMSEDKIRFGWVVPQNATELNGTLKVMPFAFGESPVSSENLYVIKELYAEYTVRKGLEISGGIAQPNENWYKQFLLQMLEYIERASDVVEQIGTSVEDTKRYRDETEKIKNETEKAVEGVLEEAEAIKQEVEGYSEYVEKAKDEAARTMQDAEEVQKEVELSRESAANSALLSRSYAEGNTGVREDEAIRNARYFMEQAQRLVEAVSSGALVPVGTITFEEIPESPITGYMYNISNSFITDDRFVEGVGMRYNSGVNVYWTKDGKLDVLAGVPPTKEEIGLGKVPNVTTNDQTPTFTRAETRENLISGETLSILFGKLSKVVYDLAEVAFTGSYLNLKDTPDIPEIPELPNLAEVAISGSYNDLKDKPTNIESANYVTGGIYENLAGKTILRIREVLDGCVGNFKNNSYGITSVALLMGASWIDIWNREDTASILDQGPLFTFTSITLYANASYQAWLVSSYGDNQTYVITKRSSVWGKAKKLALEENIPTTPTSIGAIPQYLIDYNTPSTKEDSLNKLDNPRLLTGNIYSPHCILFRDDVGDSPLGGGVTCVFGYTYPNSGYGAQIAIKYTQGNGGSRFRIRNLNNNVWSGWSTVYDTSFKPTPADIGAVSTQASATLTVAGWSGTAAPFTQTIIVSGVTTTSIVDIDVASGVTAEQLDAYINAKIVDGGQANNSVTLKAFGDKPTVAIPLKIVVRKV